jgi:hypothetical protein
MQIVFETRASRHVHLDELLLYNRDAGVYPIVVTPLIHRCTQVIHICLAVYFYIRVLHTHIYA